MSWKEVNQSLKSKKAGITKNCGSCRRFDTCRKTKDVEPWNFIPECKDARFGKGK